MTFYGFSINFSRFIIHFKINYLFFSTLTHVRSLCSSRENWSEIGASDSEWKLQVCDTREQKPQEGNEFDSFLRAEQLHSQRGLVKEILESFPTEMNEWTKKIQINWSSGEWFIICIEFNMDDELGPSYKMLRHLVYWIERVFLWHVHTP